jgi:hypothetical protein
MHHIPITPRRVAPFVITGATGLHILTRMRRLSRQPAVDIPLHVFLVKHTDVVFSLGGASVVIWHLAKHKPRVLMPESMAEVRWNRFAVNTADKSAIASVVHHLRQVFTALLLGLGLVERKAGEDHSREIPGLVRRLMAVVQSGIDAVDVLESSGSADGQEREYGG